MQQFSSQSVRNIHNPSHGVLHILALQWFCKQLYNSNADEKIKKKKPFQSSSRCPVEFSFPSRLHSVHPQQRAVNCFLQTSSSSLSRRQFIQFSSSLYETCRSVYSIHKRLLLMPAHETKQKQVLFQRENKKKLLHLR